MSVVDPKAVAHALKALQGKVPQPQQPTPLPEQLYKVFGSGKELKDLFMSEDPIWPPFPEQ